MPIGTIERPIVLEGSLSKHDGKQLKPWVGLLSIFAIVSFSLEIEILDHIDSFARFMTYREIALDAGGALIGVLALGVVWWLGVLSFTELSRVVGYPRERAISVFWALSLSVPLSYLTLDLFNALKILWFPTWSPPRLLLLVSGLLLVIVWIAALSVVDRGRLQPFCTSRLVPIGSLHVILCLVSAVALGTSGVHLFRNYASPAKAVRSSDSPDIYLITIDALRADDMSVYGYNLPTTPNLERFGERSTVFDYFIANSNFTTPCTTSIETGLVPWSHRVFQFWGFLRESESETLGSLLKKRGYYTAVVSANVAAGPIQHRTLEGYDAVQYPAAEGMYRVWRYTTFVNTDLQSTLSISTVGHLFKLLSYLDMLIWGDRYPYPAERVFEQARSIVEKSTGQPTFLWAHILPPHDPYWPPLAFRRRFLQTEKLRNLVNPTYSDSHELPAGTTAAEHRARYDEMVLYADYAVGEFLDWLEQTGRLDRSIVIVSADHGESFEHNWFSHTGPNLYNGLIHIPLLIHLPGQKQASHVTYVAQQADLLPTIAELVGATSPRRTDGISLVPALQGKPVAERYVATMNFESNSSFDRISKGTVAILNNDFKYINYLDTGREALYRYRSDLMEDHNLIASESKAAQRMREVLTDKLRDVNQPFPPKQ